MNALITSTDQIVEIDAPAANPVGPPPRHPPVRILARVWEGVTVSGVALTAYIPVVQVASKDDSSQFERELSEHKRPDPGTQRAIDARFIL